jgi:hypothetical protein
MKRIKTLFFWFIFLSIVSYAGEQGFQKSQEEEFQETISYYAKLNGTDFEYAKTKMLAIAAKNLSRSRSIDQMIEVSKKTKEKEVEAFFSDIKSTFELLKKKMNIPDEVNIVFCDDNNPRSTGIRLMTYASHLRTIYIYPAVFDLPQTSILFAMIHELTHVQQHMRDGLLNCTCAGDDKKSLSKKEREADINAAQIIKCPWCLKSVLTHRLLEERQLSKSQIEHFASLGYLTSNDLKKYLEQKVLEDTCNVHQAVRSSDFSLGVDTQKGLEEIEEEDYKSTMFERLQ